MARDFEGYCPDTVGTAALDNPDLAEAILKARENDVPGVCAALVMSQTVFGGDRPPCATQGDCLYWRQ